MKFTSLVISAILLAAVQSVRITISSDQATVTESDDNSMILVEQKADSKADEKYWRKIGKRSN